MARSIAEQLKEQIRSGNINIGNLDYTELEERRKREREERLQQARQNVENYTNSKRESMTKISNEIQSRSKNKEQTSSNQNNNETNTNLTKNNVKKEFNKIIMKNLTDDILESNYGYVARKTGAGAVSGVTGIVQSGITDVANNLDKGKNKDIGTATADAIKAIVGISNPINMINNSIKQVSKNIGNTAKNLSDKDKTGWEKVVSYGLDSLNNATESFAPKNLLNQGIQLAGKVDPNAYDKAMKLNNKISEPINRMNEELSKESENYDEFTNFLGNVGQGVGGMIPSITATAVTKNPNIGLATMGLSVKGQATEEALRKGKDIDTAVKIGNAKMAIEMLTEKIAGGTKIFGKGNLDDLAEDLIKNKAKSTVGKFILKQIYNTGGEIAEEELSNIFDNIIDKGTTDPEKKVFDWNEFLNTAFVTAGTTNVLNSFGGYRQDYNQAKQNTLEQRNLYRDTKTGKVLNEEDQNILKKASDIIAQNQPPVVNEEYRYENKTKEVEPVKINNELPVINEQNTYKEIQPFNNTDEELPVNNEEYRYNNITEEDNLITSAEKYGYNSNNENLIEMQKALDKRGIKARFDESYFNNESEGGKYILTTDDNGNVTREIIINPKADEKTIIQEMAIHELTHDIIAGKTDKSVKMYNEIKDFLYKDKDFPNRLTQLEEAYLNIRDENGNPVYNRNNTNFNKMIEEEAIAKTLQTKFGTQEEVNRLVNYTPSKARMVYDWIVDKLNKITGGRIEKLYWEDVKNKFERAFSEEGIYNRGNINKLSKEITSDGIEYIKAEPNSFTKSDGSKMTPREVYNSLVGKTINFGDGDSAYILKWLPGKNLYNELFQRYPSYFNNIEDVKKLNTDVNYNIQELLENSKNILPNEPDKSNRHKKQGITNFDTRLVNFYDGNNAYQIEFSIAKLKDGNKVAYAKRQFDYDDNLTQKIKADETRSSKSPMNQKPLSKHSILPTQENVNSDTTNYSMQESKNNSDSFNLPENVKDIKNMNEFLRKAVENETNHEWKERLKDAKSSNYTRIDNRRTPLQYKREIVQQYLDYKNGLNNKDIRYSVSTDGAMKDNKTGKKVILDAETGSSNKTLLAIHNLNEEKLKGVLELGGFPVPSIAVTNQPHTNFGDISVIFNKNTIDPSINEANKIYSRDAYTARTPNVVNKIIESGLKEVSKNTGIEEWNLRENYKEISIEDAVEKLRRNENIIDKYLKEKGIEIEPIYRDFKGFTHLKQDSLQDFINKHKELINLSYTDKYSTDTYKKYYNDVHNLFVEDIMKEAKISREEAESFYKDYPGFNHWDYFIKDLNAVQELKGKQQLDEYATKEAKEKAVDVESKEYKDYVKNLISPMYGEKYIRNNKDYYTASGNPRSFNQRYEEYTLDNIVKIMNENKGTGQESTWGVGINEIAGDASKRFKNIEDIKKNENLLMTQDEEEHKQILDKYNTEFRDIENSILDKYSDSSIDGYVWREKSIEDAMKNIARKMASNKKITEQNVISQFDKNGIKITENQAQRVISLIKDLSTLPTNYFEAKPQRAVGFDEIDAIVIPKDVSKEVKQQLKDRGIKTIEYDRNNENERADILKSLNEYKFSKADESFDEYLTRRIGKTGTRTKLEELKNITNIEEPKLNNTAPSSEKVETENKIAKVLTEPVKKQKSAQKTWAILKANLIDKGSVFENLSLKTKNRELQAKYDATLSSGAKGQYAIGNDRYEFKNGKKIKISKSLASIIDEVGENAGDFYAYMYHQLNIDRMTLEERFNGDTGINYENKDVYKNKPVFGESVTAQMSRDEVANIEKEHPEFKEYAKDVYDFLDANKQELVDKGVISQELSDKFKDMYPHYVPIARINEKSNAINVPLDTNKTGVNSPIKKATGGSSDIQPLFNTIADRTLQTYRASARNSFGVELKNTLEKNGLLNNENSNVDIDTIIDTMTDETHTGLTEGTKDKNPTFTIFDNGERVTFEINQDMYDALKPQSELLRKINESKPSKVLKTLSNIRRGVLTEYNPIFSITNSIKDAQDVIFNSQHAMKTYAKFPEAYAQILGKGYWYNEYIQNGGEQNSYFRDGEFKIKDNLPKPASIAKKAVTFPFETISKINNVIEMSPRLAEYIASRESGKSIESSMLDASRVTTNFKAGGDITKTLNRNGFTFLNAGVQGMEQAVRNVREANAKGLKGYAVLATKMALAGLPTIILNNLVWNDDDDYEELQDYVKDNYYIVGKIGEHQFIRIPKGRPTSVIQKIISTADKYLTDKKEININNLADDFWSNVLFTKENLAPNDPTENNILSPLFQVAKNKTWYGDDLIPKRLQDVPEAEQYDETTDQFSKWVGQTLNWSPKKINYLLDQYLGGVGDVLLPLGTPQAENNAIEDKFTTNSIMKNRNPGEFYSKLEKLEVNNNSSKATDEDNLKYKYMSDINTEMSSLYKEKREEQNSNDTDEVKKKKVQEIQNKINELAKNGLKNVDNLKVNNNTAKINDIEYYKTTNVKDKNQTWKKISEEDKKKNNNISLSTYRDYKEKLAQETIKQRSNGTIKEDGSIKDSDKINILANSRYSNKEKQAIYENYIKSSNDKKYDIIKEVANNSGTFNINSYLDYKLAVANGEFKADRKDDGTEDGKTISGSAKKKALNYINNMDNTNYMQKIVMYGLTNTPNKSDKQTIVNYIKNMNGISNSRKNEILHQFEWITFYKDGTFKY